jgi:putative ABC transport system permease protein
MKRLIAFAVVLAARAGRLRPDLRQLHGQMGRHVIAFEGMSAVMVTVALLASYVPALRASRVDPALALRTE